jgi:branched-chain amino acid transport system substrate-binding protein
MVTTRTRRHRGGSQESKRKRQESNPAGFDFCLSTLDFLSYLLRAACFLLCLLPLPGLAQQPKPYAAINRDAVSYNGPGRDIAHDLTGREIRLGLLAPLTGPRKAEGDALQHAAEMAIEEENAASLPGGRHLALVTRDESGPWGQASTQIVHMLFDDQAVALITSADGGAAHLAEQVANKVGVPVLTLSTDTTTTEINLPWIFRLGPADAAQARAFARDIYGARKLQRVALVAEDDHDGRVGGDEFEKAAREMNAPAPTRITVEPDRPRADTLRDKLQGAQAVVIWTDAAIANRLVGLVREELPSAPLYLCRKAAENDPRSEDAVRQSGATRNSKDPGAWTVAAPKDQGASRSGFEQRYRRLFGTAPGIDAAQVYDAVRVLAASLHQSGPNRARLRDALAGVSGFPGASGIISFDHAGNDTSQLSLLRLY